jgi:hypothetical protein
MKKLLIVCLLVVSYGAVAQKWPSDLWHEGKVVLEKGDTLIGLVKYDLTQDLIQYNDRRGNIEAFTARKILFFEIFDTTVRQYRQFYALPYQSSGTNYRVPVFFELLTEGKMTLLTRESLEYRTYTSPYYFGSYSRLVLVYNFFLLEENGDIVAFNGKKGDLLAKMGRKQEIVDDYMRENKLRIDDKADFAKVVAYYNSLF